MCSILFNNYKVNKNLISIVKEYLLSNLDDNKSLYSTTLKSYMKNIYPNEFLKKYYFLQMKRRFPQKHYHINLSLENKRFVNFYIPNVKNVRFSEFFIKNIWIQYHIQIDLLENNVAFYLDNHKIMNNY
jgi:hypothetical protein